MLQVMAAAIPGNIEEKYNSQSRCTWIWFRVTEVLEKLECFKIYAENNIDKISYCEYQFEITLNTEVSVLGIIKWKKRTSPRDIQNFFINYNHKWGSLVTAEDIKIMKVRCCEKDYQFDGSERVIIGKNNFDRNYNAQTPAQNMESRIREVVDMINEYGPSRASIKWSDEDGSHRVFERALKQYNYKMKNEKRKEMLEIAEQIVWKEWQQYVVDYLHAPIDPREILVILDEKGNSGKTFLIKHFTTLNEETTSSVRFAKTSDIMHIISKKPRLENILFNLPRSIDDVNYTLLEETKDGEICTTKYDGNEERNNFCRVVVFSNKPLNWEALSLDRWKIMTIKQDGSFVVEKYEMYKMMGR